MWLLWLWYLLLASISKVKSVLASLHKVGIYAPLYAYQVNITHPALNEVLWEAK